MRVLPPAHTCRFTAFSLCPRVTAEALRGLGQEHLVVEACPGLGPERYLHSLRRAGLYHKGMESNDDFPQAGKLSTLILLGRYDEVLDAGVDDPSLMRIRRRRRHWILMPLCVG